MSGEGGGGEGGLRAEGGGEVGGRGGEGGEKLYLTLHCHRRSRSGLKSCAEQLA